MRRAGRVEPVAVARIRVVRSDGTTEIVYSTGAVPWWHVRRRRRRRRHLAWMREEDEQWR